MHKEKWKFTPAQKLWIKEYFKCAFNASKAARTVYGGTPASCRVKGWKKRTKFDAILDEIFRKRIFKIEGGVDAYLIWLEDGNCQLLRDIERKQRQLRSENSGLRTYSVRKLRL